MRASIGKNSLQAAGLLVAVLLTSLTASAAQITTNWVAFNDYTPSTRLIQVGSNPPPVLFGGPAGQPSDWGTSVRATIYNLRVASTGNALSNFLTGAQLPVTLGVSTIGTPDNFGECYEPNTNTPAYNLFHGIADVGNSGSVIGVRYSGPSATLLTFSGLDPAKHYVFRGTSSRRGGYALRWTVATLIGANSWIDGHLSGAAPGGTILTSNNYPADLGPGQAAWDSGDNSEGAVIGWDFISPAPDGTFSIQSSNYVGHTSTGVLADTTHYGYAVSSFLLAEVEATPPVITTHPPALTTVEQNRPFSLSVAASGTPLFYQWYNQATGAITGATFSTYSVAQAALGDSGNYFAVVYNPLDRATSTVAHVTVNADTSPPGVSTAFSYPSFDFATPQTATLNQVTVEFNEAIQAASATVASHYLISGGIGNPASVTLASDRAVVLSLSSALTADTPYTVTVNGVLDLAGNNVDSGGTNNPASFRSWAQGLGAGVGFDYYQAGSGATVDVLTNSPVFPDSPSLRTNLWAFDERVVFSDDSHTAYGSRMRAVFIPPVSGEWVFFVRTYDRGNVYFNPNGLDPAGAQFILGEITGSNPRDWNKFISAPFTLRGGQGYYLEALQKVDTGTSMMKVAARLTGTGLPGLGIPDNATNVDTNSLAGPMIAWPYAPRDLGGSLTVVRDVLDATVDANHIAVFSFLLNNPSGLPVTYKWFKNGSEVPGVTGPVYSFVAGNADNGSTISAQALKVGSLATSRTAALSVVPDTHPPHAIDASSSATNLTTILIEFDEPMDMMPANDNFSYSITGGSSILSATLQPDQQTVALVLDTPLTLGNPYQVDVDTSHDDLAGNLIADTILTVVAGAGPPLTITRSGTSTDISWPANYTAFILEKASTLSASTWTRVGAAPVLANGRYTVSVAVGPGGAFFRSRQ